MVIYGVALLAVCLLAGLFVGDALGVLIGVEANVGGVGIAMLLLILLGNRLERRRPFLPATREGILFWSGIYIPIVVAMAARQNVVAALDGGLAAFLAGALAVAAGLFLVPVLSRVGARPPDDGPTTGPPSPEER
ncbi:MAG TPA: malonate transporter subunit MadL [Longimicrobiales bacterium]|nr:malonate transporter subunit MadL [Longimicrobiales bacterium]